jgi:hypothetical protein
MRTPATASVIAVEAAVAAVVVVVAAAGVSGPAWLLVAGLAGHGFKDLWQHRSHFVANTRWWPPFCLVVDWVVAAILVLLIAVGEESKGDQRAGHRPHVDSSAPGHLADVGAAGGLEHELLGGQGADERLLACLLLHADTPVAWRARWRLSTPAALALRRRPCRRPGLRVAAQQSAINGARPLLLAENGDRHEQVRIWRLGLRRCMGRVAGPMGKVQPLSPADH